MDIFIEIYKGMSAKNIFEAIFLLWNSFFIVLNLSLGLGFRRLGQNIKKEEFLQVILRDMSEL